MSTKPAFVAGVFLRFVDRDGITIAEVSVGFDGGFSLPVDTVVEKSSTFVIDCSIKAANSITEVDLSAWIRDRK